MQTLTIDLHIPKEEWLKIYRGETQRVHATARDGRTVQFPANILSAYVTHNGIHGSFAICFSDEGKFISVKQIGGRGAPRSP